MIVLGRDNRGGGGDVGEEGLGEGGEGGRLLTKVRVDDEEVEGRQQGACKKPVLMGLRQDKIH